MNENGNEKSSLLLVLVFGACFHLPFVGFCCSPLLVLVFEIESVLSQKLEHANVFGCSFWLFIARLGFLQMFQFEHRIARFGFMLVLKTKTNNKRKNKSKWKPGLTASSTVCICGIIFCAVGQLKFH